MSQPPVVPAMIGDGTTTHAHPHLISIAPDYLMVADVALEGPYINLQATNKANG